MIKSIKKWYYRRQLNRWKNEWDTFVFYDLDITCQDQAAAIREKIKYYRDKLK